MKILITGNVASGKTSLSKILSNFYEIKRFEIDEIVHDIENNYKKRTLKEQIKIINTINKENKHYIIEGVLRKNQDFILNLVDQIIYLDIDKKILKRRIKKRYIKQKLKLEKSSYTPSKEMLNNMYKWNNEFNSKDFLKRISKFPKKLIIIKNKNELKKYLNSVYKNGSYIE